MAEFPPPIRLPGEPAPPREPQELRHGSHVPPVVDEDVDVFGAEEAAALLAARLANVEPGPARIAEDGRPLLSPPSAPARDRIEGLVAAGVTLVVFGAHGTPSSRSLGDLLARVRRDHVATVGVVWRHYPDPAAHPRAAMLALAVEAAAARGRFWTLTRELLHMRHHDPPDLHAALVRSGLEPDVIRAAMRAGTGADRIVADVASALASGVTYSPALFIDGERYRGELDSAGVFAALDAAVRES
jgi:2-hydroxychromene-2-carboxylate isomerase